MQHKYLPPLHRLNQSVNRSGRILVFLQSLRLFNDYWHVFNKGSFFRNQSMHLFRIAANGSKVSIYEPQNLCWRVSESRKIDFLFPNVQSCCCLYGQWLLPFSVR